MNVFTGINNIKLAVFFAVLIRLFTFDNEVVAQDCFTLYGPTGEPAIGLDYKLCSQSPGMVTLNAGTLSSTSTYVWSTTATTASITVSSGGLYTVSVSDGGVANACVLTFNVTAYNNPVVNLGNDTAICTGDSLTFFANQGMANYIWSDGSTHDTLTVSLPDTYSVTVSDTNQCVGIDTVVLMQNPLPTPNLGGLVRACLGDTITLNPGGYISYIWSDGSTGATLDVHVAGSYGVTVTDTNGCKGADVVSFINDTLPVIDIGPDDSLCDGLSKTLNVFGGPFNSYLWSNGDTMQSSTFSYTSNPYVFVTDTNGCVGSDTMHLEIFPLPVVNLGNNNAFCQGDSLVLDAGAGFVMYSWSDASTAQTITVISQGNYSVTVMDSNQCLGADTTFVAQKPLPFVNIGQDIEYCKGTTFTQLLDAGSGFTLYTWMDGIFTQIRQITQANDTVWVEVVDTNGCINRDTIFVIENQLPTLNLGSDDTICTSQLYSLNAGNQGGTIVSYQWSTGATTQTLNIPPNPYQLADSTANYSVTITDNKGCVNQDTMTLHTYALPRPDLGNDTAFCSGDPFSMILNPGNFVSYVWSTGATTPTISIGAIGSQYMVTVLDTNGCQNSDDIVVTENPLPTPNLGPDEAYCSGNSYTKILNPGSFLSYLWTDGSTSQVLGVSSAGIYGVTVTDAFGCENSDNIVITENPSPQVDLGPDVTYCAGDTFAHLLDATTNLSGGGFTFLWNTGATTGTIIVTSFDTYNVVVSDTATGCNTLSNIKIVAMTRAVPDLGDDDIICKGQLLTLDPGVNIPGYNYTWNTGATTATINVFEPGTYWVRLDAADSSCIGITDTIHFNQGVLPIVELGEDIYPCIGQEVVIQNNITPFPGTIYRWQDGSTRPVYFVTQTGLYIVEATNSCGTVIDQVFIEFQDCGQVYVPNSFSPNGDGKNDIFYVESSQEFMEYGLWIYDRWGKLVFKTNQPDMGWDGKVDGVDAQMGLYVWRLSYVSAFDNAGSRLERMGYLNLIR